MLIMFDCDGVLVDSEIIAAKVDSEHLAEVGFKITPEEVIRRFAGLTSEGIVEIIEAEIGKPLPPEFLAEQQAELNRRLAAEVEAMPGALEMLDVLEGPRCVCSNSSTERLRITMERTGLWDRFAPNIWSAVEVGDQEAEARSERLSLRPRAVPRRSARCDGRRGFGVRRHGRPCRRRPGRRLHRRPACLAGPRRPADRRPAPRR